LVGKIAYFTFAPVSKNSLGFCLFQIYLITLHRYYAYEQTEPNNEKSNDTDDACGGCPGIVQADGRAGEGDGTAPAGAAAV
jgi:hypothetical protein